MTEQLPGPWARQSGCFVDGVPVFEQLAGILKRHFHNDVVEFCHGILIAHPYQHHDEGLALSRATTVSIAAEQTAWASRSTYVATPNPILRSDRSLASDLSTKLRGIRRSAIITLTVETGQFPRAYDRNRF